MYRFLGWGFNFLRVLFPKRMGFGGDCEEGHDMFAYDIILTQQIGDDVDGARRAAMSPQPRNHGPGSWATVGNRAGQGRAAHIAMPSFWAPRKGAFSPILRRWRWGMGWIS